MDRALCFLKRYGYLPGIPWEDIDKLARSDQIVEDASYQLQELYGDDIIGSADGHIGPKTMHAMSLPRCGHPDKLDDPEISCITQSRRDMAGSGSWPASCHESGITLSLDKRNSPLPDATLERLDSEMRKEYAQVGCLIVRDDGNSRANIRQSFRRGSGWIGLAEFNNRTCGDSVFCYRDSRWDGGHVRNLNLNLHEVGHNCNLQHTRGGIMAPTINSSPNHWVTFDSAGKPDYQDVSYRTLAKFFGGFPIGEPPTPPPPEPPMKFLDFLIELIARSFESGQDADRIRERIKEPRAIDWLRVERGARIDSGLSRRDWRKVRAEKMQELRDDHADLTEEDIDDLLLTARTD
jgi:hypothetical protein